MSSEYVLDRDQLDLVELMLSRCLGSLEGFTPELPLIVPTTVSAGPGSQLRLLDGDGVPVAMVSVESPAPAVTGRLERIAGVAHEDALDLRRSPQGVRSCANGRPSVGIFMTEALRPNQLQALALAARRRHARVLLLSPLGAHDAGEAGWYARAAAARVTADLVREALGGRPEDVTLVAVPRPPRTSLQDTVIRSFGAEPVDLPEPEGPLPSVVVAELARFADPASGRGVVVFFTGLPGSGKSTVARAVAARVMEAASRRVTLLDGDVVRRHLSSELGFSAEDRDRNVRRIGWVAAEVARHGGLALACPIAPYAAARSAARDMARSAGGVFVLVHVATPLQVCEERDLKGHYAAARAGDMTDFTGINDPYESPTDADVVLDTSVMPLDECVDAVVFGLQAARLLT